jgi:L-asparaginase II
MGVDHRDYIEPTHPVQRAVAAVLEGLSGLALGEDRRATDGCSVPTWALPLTALARVFARFGAGHALAPARAEAARRLRRACAQHPWYVAGTGRFCTELMQHFGERVFVKTGAEGAFCGALPEQGIGFAVKCDDGATRAAEVVVACLIERLLPRRTGDRTVIDRFVRPTLRNWNGISVGSLHPTSALDPRA